ncbi:hypothetical protein E3N88_18594 [Mikania micrantha]|uniref:Reverse transcriptase domain-containing protein n=1 Tax=Mikania micrantha TaxID=192012 RepID=A0A5N6NNK7_9ASTR|nr:hypothetical protein E3N88_18594 [Mikania micrantha]
MSVPKVGFRRLTPTEIAQKRAQGLCYRCDEKYTWDHKCKSTPQLLFFDEDSQDSGVSPDSPSSVSTDSQLAEKLQLDEVQTQSAISYNALSGGCSSTTLRFTGLVKGKSVQVLLDGGSTHCFVQTRIATFLNFPIESIEPFSVLVGSGERLPCSGLARAVELIIQGHPLVVDLYVLPLQGWDMVLGVSWLATLGPVITDYSKSTFEFSHNGHQVIWHGDVNTAQAIQFHGFQHLLHTGGIGQMYQLTIIPSNPIATVYPADLQALLDRFAPVFTAPTGLPPTRTQDHHITLLPNSQPVLVRPYRYPHFQKQEIERLVSEMLQQGIIQPSTSSFSSPVLLDRFPIPSIDELFDELYGAQFFSKLDLLAGYHQIRLTYGDTSKTAFRTHDGHYEFLVMPFGLTNAPSTFQRLMNDVFRPFLRRFILVFFDDILIYSKTWDDHLHHIAITLQLLLDHSLVAKLSKCIFGQTQVAYLGHVISATGVAVDPDKISTIQQWPIPTNVKQVRNFLGLAGYYRRFIQNYASIAGPLTDLLRKDAFCWNEHTLHAFTQLKHLLSSTPVLHLPDFSKPFTLETDASGSGIGAVLSQDKHPVAYFSKKLCPRMQQASTYHREMYANTQAIAKWRRQNSAADALSRVPSAQLMAISTPIPTLLRDLAAAIHVDPYSADLFQQYLANPSHFPDYSVKEGLLFFKGRLYVHRVGQTVRAGREGYDVTFVTDNDRSLLKAIVKRARSKLKSRIVAKQSITKWKQVNGQMEDQVASILREERDEMVLSKAEMEEDNVPKFQFYDPKTPFCTSPRFFPPSKIETCRAANDPISPAKRIPREAIKVMDIAYRY